MKLSDLGRRIEKSCRTKQQNLFEMTIDKGNCKEGFISIGSLTTMKNCKRENGCCILNNNKAQLKHVDTWLFSFFKTIKVLNCGLGNIS